MILLVDPGQKWWYDEVLVPVTCVYIHHPVLKWQTGYCGTVLYCVTKKFLQLTRPLLNVFQCCTTVPTMQWFQSGCSSKVCTEHWSKFHWVSFRLVGKRKTNLCGTRCSQPDNSVTWKNNTTHQVQQHREHWSVTVSVNVKMVVTHMKSLFYGLITFSVYFALHPSPWALHTHSAQQPRNFLLLLFLCCLHLFVVILWIFTLILHHSAVTLTPVCHHFTAVFRRFAPCCGHFAFLCGCI